MTQKSMDIFGEALLAYAKGDRSKFILRDESGKRNVEDLACRFRSYSKFNKTEKKLVSLVKGNILDIGCGTGNIVPALEKKGKVTAIDISPKVIALANSKGHKNCIVANIFNFAPKKKYDTITLFGNNIGIGATAKNTNLLLTKLASLLKKDGQILAITRNYHHGDYNEMILTPIWKKSIGPKFGWFVFSLAYFVKMCRDNNLKAQVLSKSWRYGLVKITRK